MKKKTIPAHNLNTSEMLEMAFGKSFAKSDGYKYVPKGVKLIQNNGSVNTFEAEFNYETLEQGFKEFFNVVQKIMTREIKGPYSIKLTDNIGLPYATFKIGKLY